MKRRRSDALFPARQGRAGICDIRALTAQEAACAAVCAVHQRCVRCESQSRPRAVGNGRARCKSDGEVGAGDRIRPKPPRRVSGGRSARSRRQSCAARCRRRRRRCPHRCGRRSTARCGARCAKRSAGARARAETPARRFVHGAVPEPVRGAACTGEARSAAAASRGELRSRRSRRRASEARTPTSAARSAGARRPRRSGTRCGRTSSPRRRPGNGGERSEPPGKRSAQ